MKKVMVFRDNQVIISDAKLVDTFRGRLFGLMMTKNLDKKNGLILKKCKQIHTFNMKYVIDAVFLSRDNTIIHIEHMLSPNRMTRYIHQTESILEVVGGTASIYGLTIGDTLTIVEKEELQSKYQS